MVSGRPLLYLSIPGVAFILGVFWFRRRNKNRIDNGEIKAGRTEDPMPYKESNDELLHKSNVTTNNAPPVTSKSMNINGSIVDDNTFVKFGKSAPISIVQNGRNSPKKLQQQIDSEILKTKIQNAEHKVLRSIDEDFEVDLPDSINVRVPFYSRTVSSNKDGPIVIRATTTPKISPENSFLESKYTKECEQNNNCDSDSASNEKCSQLSTLEQMKKVQQNEQQTDTIINSNGNEKRNVETSSPSLSLCSVQSGDSGKGSSLPRSEAARAKTSYEFLFPNTLVGQLYGRKRSFLNQIKASTSANVLLRKKIYSGKVRICVIEGTENEIKAALLMIRQRLPAKQYPNFTMQRIHYALPQTVVPLSSENLVNLQLNLIEGINNDVIVSAVVNGGHIFLQHPLHPTHPSLAVLQKYLYDSYSASEAPLLPSIEISAVCVLPVNGIWYRVQIVDQDAEEEQRCIVKFLDFGGYINVHFEELRQIRSDFMGVPFQATECVLSNIEPIDACWSIEAADILCKLTKGIVLQAQVAGYNSHNIPEIYLFACLGPNNVIFINKELVARNLARWVDVRD